MIDLHSHTFYSDGSSSPEELLQLAAAAGLNALAITDHDNIAGYQYAASLPRPAGLELICGIEITCKVNGRSAHLLGYFLDNGPGPEFSRWLTERSAMRQDRNRRLIRRLQSLGANVELEEVEALGRNMTGRPHFARVLLNKGYVSTYEEAFQRYLGEDGIAFVHHEGAPIEEAIRRVHDAGGFTSLAHPIRLNLGGAEEELLVALARKDLDAVEVFHSDHSPRDHARYLEIARRHHLAVTGGSDFHGAVKPRIQLGSVGVEDWVLDELRERFS